MVLAVHEPAAVGGDVGLVDDEVEIGEELHHLQQHAVPVHAINLDERAVLARLIVDDNPAAIQSTHVTKNSMDRE